MTTIEKLIIRGIRAFDPDHHESITFGVPLTLIVGHNGAGKTTIIEAMKYVTAGILPPGIKGNETSYIHDPDLNGEKETQAQVQILLKTQNGAKVTGTRQPKVINNRGKLAFSAKEGNGIRMQRNMESTVQPQTKASMDIAMAMYLGVNAAVLDRVIFCHQDESLWPMLPPKDVKQYFDELFEIKKYAEAIDRLKSIQRELAGKLKEFKLTEGTEKEHKDQGRAVEALCQRLHDEIKDLSETVGNLSIKIEEAEAKAATAFEHAARAGEIVGKLNNTRQALQNKEDYLKNIMRTLQELDDDIETLEDMLANYEKRSEAYRQSIEGSREHAHALQKQIESARVTQSKQDQEVGSAEAQELNYDRQVGLRKDLIKNIAQRHELRGFSSEVDDHQIQSFVQRITRMAADHNAAVDNAKRESRVELQELQKAKDVINAKRTTLSSRKDNARQQTRDNDVKINKYQQEHDAIDVDEGSKYVLQSNLDNIQGRLQSTKDKAREADWTSKEKQLDAEQTTLQVKKQSLNDELKKATESVRDTAQLEFAQNELRSQQQRLDTMTGAHKDKINDVVGPSWHSAQVKSLFDSKVAEAVATHTKAEKQLEDMNRELVQVDSQRQKCTAKIREHENAFKKAADAIHAVTVNGPTGYHDEVKQLEESRNTIKTDADSCEVMRNYFSQCIKDAEQQHVCRTCTRAVKEKDLDTIKAGLVRQRDKYDSRKIAAELAEVDQELSDVKAVSWQVDLWERLTKTEVPALKAELEQLGQGHERIEQRLEEQDSIVSELSNKKRDIEAISKIVNSIATLHSDIQNNSKNVLELKRKLENAGLSRGLTNINEDLDELHHNEQSVQSSLKKLREEKDKVEKTINRLELDYRDAQRDLAAADRQFNEKLTMAKQIEELKTANDTQKAVMRECDEALESSKKELDQAQERLDNADMQSSRREQELQTTASKINDSLNQLNLASKAIEAYLNNGGPDKLKLAKQSRDKIKKEIDELSGEYGSVLKEIKAIEEQQRDHNDTRRNIEDNITYRKQSNEIQTLRQEIKDLEAYGAEADNHRYLKEAEDWRKEGQRYNIERAGASASAKEKDSNLQQRLEEYDTIYKNAAKNYRKAHIQVETTKAAIEDLSRYAGALDKAIMKFHSIKMAEINRIIDELWRKTYQGTDVDTIFIQSDAESSNNKNYNYRVCMLKQRTEMDMRGRCSAGQKVLACIIIRLALAEVFGVNCGLIALDEPTTNLDRENIQALALALSELIKVRKAQKNFQLILITHDEEFLKFMNPSDHVDYYYRISRNSKQKSQIKQEQISYLMRY